jgi:hypothetical protein
MAASNYYARAKQLFQQCASIKEKGFVVEVWGKGADHNELLQIKKPSWRVNETAGESIGYKGIEVHYESCRPGHWVLHCELWPRLGKKEKAQVAGVAKLIERKGEITRFIRNRGREAGWEEALGAHLRRTRKDPSDPSSLIVYTFDLGLTTEHSPEMMVDKSIRVVEATAPIIDHILMETSRI